MFVVLTVTTLLMLIACSSPESPGGYDTDVDQAVEQATVEATAVGISDELSSTCVRAGQGLASMDLSRPARRIIYEWETNGFKTDPAPNGNDDYAGKLLLDDLDPELDTDNTWALAAHRHSRDADQYFRSLATEGYGIWDGCYGKTTSPIITARIGYPIDNETGWQGDGYAEALYHNDDITRAAVTHELTHGMMIHLLGIKSDWEHDVQTGALFESTADVFAALVTGRYALRTIEGIKRDLEHPTDDNRQADHWVFLDQQMSEYFNAGIPSYAAYLMAEGGTHPTEVLVRDGDVFEPVEVTPIGREKVARIYFHALDPQFIKQTTSGEPGTYTFLEFATGIVDACTDLMLSGKGEVSTNDCAQVERAFEAVGIIRGVSDSNAVDVDVEVDPGRYELVSRWTYDSDIIGFPQGISDAGNVYFAHHDRIITTFDFAGAQIGRWAMDERLRSIGAASITANGQIQFMSSVSGEFGQNYLLSYMPTGDVASEIVIDSFGSIDLSAYEQVGGGGSNRLGIDSESGAFSLRTYGLCPTDDLTECDRYYQLDQYDSDTGRLQTVWQLPVGRDIVDIGETPPSVGEFLIGDDGFSYHVSSFDNVDHIIKISPVGEIVFSKPLSFGEVFHERLSVAHGADGNLFIYTNRWGDAGSGDTTPVVIEVDVEGNVLRMDTLPFADTDEGHGNIVGVGRDGTLYMSWLGHEQKEFRIYEVAESK
jgi:hypothetical protein